MCGVSYSLSGYEVYDQAKPNMKEAHEWIIKYGNRNNQNQGRRPRAG